MPPTTQIRIRRDTAANFTNASPAVVLALGEIAYETDTRNLKVGDGATAWTALPYINPYRAGTAAAPTSNTVMGSGAGVALTSAAVDNVLIGQSAGDALTVSGGNVAIGTNALGSSNAGAASITNTTPGTGGVAGAYGGVQLEKDSGTGTMAGYPQLTVVVGAGGSVTSVIITNPGSGATATSGIVFRVASPVPAGVPSDWRGTLASVTGGNVAIGQNALALGVPTVVSRTAIGANALDAATTAPNAIAIGEHALGALTTGGPTIAIGNNAAPAYTTGSDAIVIGHNAATSNTGDPILVIGNNSLANYPSNAARTTIVGHGVMVIGSPGGGNDNTAIGWRAARLWASSAGRNVAVGTEAGSYHGTGTDLNTGGESSIYIGYQSRASANSQTNQIVIGTNVVGNGSNTTTIGNSSTTGTFIPAGNLTLTNGNLILGTAGNGISFAATSDPSIPAVAATGTITRTATNVSNNDTVTLGSQVYTFKTTLTPADYEVLIGADSTASLLNLARAINNSGGTPGTDYQVPVANTSASAGTIVGSVIPLTALTAGAAGNSIALAETSAQLSVSGATLNGGADARGATSELLNDYEVGTFTPSVSGFSSVAYGSTRLGWYVKIGAIVYFHIDITLSTAVAASTRLEFTGLPYTAASGTEGRSGAWWTFSSAFAAGPSAMPYLYLGNGTSTLLAFDTNGSNYLTSSIATPAGIYRCAGMYRTS